MPPCIDIYMMTKNRDFVTLTKFVDGYVDLARSNEVGFGDLMVLPLGALGNPEKENEWEWVKVSRLSEIVEYGLKQPWRGFSVYLRSKNKSIYRVILSFSIQGDLILGLSLDDPDETNRVVDDVPG